MRSRDHSFIRVLAILGMLASMLSVFVVPAAAFPGDIAGGKQVNLQISGVDATFCDALDVQNPSGRVTASEITDEALSNLGLEARDSNKQAVAAECDALLGDGNDSVVITDNDADSDGSPDDVDCVDDNASIFPGAHDSPGDGIDQDCAGGDAVPVDPDADNDGYTVGGGDCNDGNTAINPGATGAETIVDNVDNDCDHQVDEEVPVDQGLNVVETREKSETVNPDADNDGYTVEQGDCNDGNSDINPGMTGAEAVAEGVDNDCDGFTDEDVPVDADGDKFSPPADCNDNEATINPSANDVPGDGIDQDCVGGDAEEINQVDAQLVPAQSRLDTTDSGEGQGTLTITKYVCTGIDQTQGGVNARGPENEDCQLSDNASFQLLKRAQTGNDYVAVTGVDLTLTNGTVTVNLDGVGPGNSGENYRLVENNTGFTEDFSLGVGDPVGINVFNPSAGGTQGEGKKEEGGGDNPSNNPTLECSRNGGIYLDKIDDIQDAPSNRTYTSVVEGIDYTVHVSDNSSGNDTYTISPDPSTQYPNATGEIFLVEKFGNGGGLSHITICERPVTETDTGKITVTKTDQNNNPLEGVEFELYTGPTATGTPVDTQTTNRDGEAVFDGLTLGQQYTVHEVSAPTGCMAGADQQVTPTETTPEQPVTVVNQCPESGTVTVIKYVCEDATKTDPEIVDPAPDDCGEPVTTGYTFDIEDSTGASVLPPNADLLAGPVTVPAGTGYQLTEDGTDIGNSFDLNDDDELTFTVVNYVAPDEKDITIIKRFCEADTSESPNSNCTGRVPAPNGTQVTFNVYAGTDTSVAPIDTIVVSVFDQGSGSQGQATKGGFEEGATYTVCEVPVSGFDAEPRPGNQGGSTQTGVSGAPCIEVVLGSGNNVLQFNNFAEPPPPAETGTVTVEKFFCTVETPGDPVIGNPADYDDCRAATDADSYTLSLDGETYTTAQLEAGVELAAGTYALFEGETKVGDITVTDADQTVQVLNFVATPDDPNGSITIIKEDEDGNRLKGAVFALYEGPDTSGDPLATQTTGENGTVVFTGLEIGQTYTVVEVEAPAGCEQVGGDRRVSPTVNDPERVITIVNECELEVETGTVVMTKVFIGDRDIGERVCFQLERNGQPVGDEQCLLTSALTRNDAGNLQGTVTFTDVPAGDYQVVETEGPASYTSDAPKTVTVTAGGTARVTITNTAKTPPEENRGSITVIKEDLEGNRLAGVEFALYEGLLVVPEALVDTQVTNENGMVVFENLEIGQTYTVVEVEAPAGCEQVGGDRRVSPTEGDPERVITIFNKCEDPEDPGEPNKPEDPGEPNKSEDQPDKDKKVNISVIYGPEPDVDKPTVTTFPSTGDSLSMGQDHRTALAFMLGVMSALMLAGAAAIRKLREA